MPNQVTGDLERDATGWTHSPHVRAQGVREEERALVRHRSSLRQLRVTYCLPERPSVMGDLEAPRAGAETIGQTVGQTIGEFDRIADLLTIGRQVGRRRAGSKKDREK